MASGINRIFVRGPWHRKLPFAVFFVACGHFFRRRPLHGAGEAPLHVYIIENIHRLAEPPVFCRWQYLSTKVRLVLNYAAKKCQLRPPILMMPSRPVSRYQSFQSVEHSRGALSSNWNSHRISVTNHLRHDRVHHTHSFMAQRLTVNWNCLTNWLRALSSIWLKLLRAAGVWTLGSGGGLLNYRDNRARCVSINWN